MLETVLDSIHNYFVKTKHRGTFQIVSGVLSVDFLIPGQYFRIVGSVLNDGVYQYPPETLLNDETFSGEIWALAVPPAVVALTNEISEWIENNPATDKTSESFGGYSYSRATGATGAPLSWRDVFRSRLNKWRKL